MLGRTRASPGRRGMWRGVGCENCFPNTLYIILPTGETLSNKFANCPDSCTIKLLNMKRQGAVVGGCEDAVVGGCEDAVVGGFPCNKKALHE